MSARGRSALRTQMGSRGIWTAASLTLILLGASAEARITRIEITVRESPTFDGVSFGSTGPYEKLRGRMHGEVDPGHPLNAVIVNIEKAPRTALGMVEYVTNFLILKPVDMSKGNGRLVRARLGAAGARDVLAVYYIPGMGRR